MRERERVGQSVAGAFIAIQKKDRKENLERNKHREIHNDDDALIDFSAPYISSSFFLKKN